MAKTEQCPEHQLIFFRVALPLPSSPYSEMWRQLNTFTFFLLNIFYHHRNRSTKFWSVCNSHQILNLLMEVMTLLSNNVPFIQRYSVNVELIDSFDKCETSFKCHFLLLELKVGLTLLSFKNEAISNMPSVKEKKKTCKLQ